jgi:ComF family protein
LVAVGLAPACAACDRPHATPTRGAICDPCWAAIVPFVPPLCATCGDPLPSWRTISIAEERCARCRRRPSFLTSAHAIGAYDGALRSILHAFKYDGRRSVARPLAGLMRQAAADAVRGSDLAVPVPLHRWRRISRGFNQAEDLARWLGMPVAHVLRRTRRTHSQTDLPAAQRHANVRGAFRSARGSDVRGCCVLLVDDVCTTGATLGACAEVLLAAGAREVRAVTAARVASRPR